MRRFKEKRKDKKMRGFKAFNEDLTCRGFRYEIGHTYEFDGKPIPDKQGFHFCKSIADCYEYYSRTNDTRICVIDAIGDISTDDDINYCTNKIVILEEITEEWKKRGNGSASNTGYCNTGNYNAGNCNTGDYNTGYYNIGNYNAGNRNTENYNTGNYNTGDSNTGDGNTGDSNAGNCNTGNYNTGNCNNTGNRNTGNYNTGDWNTGDRNTGDGNTGDSNTGYGNTGNYNTGNRNAGDGNTGGRNTGDGNTGDSNTGDSNTGNYNTGNYNTGDSNTGDYNTGYRNTGVFNTENPLLTFFDKPSEWTYDQWFYSDARRILEKMEQKVVEWICEKDMSDEEKVKNPTYKTTEGYLKVYDIDESRQLCWDSLSEDEKQVFINLPNYDEEKFAAILGIKLK